MTNQDALAAEEIADLGAAMQNLDGDVDLLAEIADLLIKHAPDLFAEIEEQIAAGDVEAVAISAHGMKGGATNVGAVAFVDAARRLEMRAQGGTLDGASEMLADMRAEFDRLRRTLAAVDWANL